MSDERRCSWCRHYRAFPVWDRDGSMRIDRYCSLQHNRPLQPCADYEREPGADDDLWGGPAHMRQVADDERGEHD